jgi:hypothetical protein
MKANLNPRLLCFTKMAYNVSAANLEPWGLKVPSRPGTPSEGAAQVGLYSSHINDDENADSI